MIEITPETAKAVLKTVNAGLIMAVGERKPGKMCVEAAIAYALGLPHNDRPECVEEAVIEFSIKLNDCPWSSPKKRAAGLRRLALAQLGSAGSIIGSAFSHAMADHVIRQVLPITMRAASQGFPLDEGLVVLQQAADHCERSDLLVALEAAMKAGRFAVQSGYRSASAGYGRAQLTEDVAAARTEAIRAKASARSADMAQFVMLAVDDLSHALACAKQD
ncbi:MAG: hypothetical protein ACREB5_09240, partial [Sphingomonadaceae bacterium]